MIVVYLNGEKGDEEGVLWVRETRDLKAQEARKALELVRGSHAQCLAKWEEIHG